MIQTSFPCYKMLFSALKLQRRFLQNNVFSEKKTAEPQNQECADKHVATQTGKHKKML